MADPRTDQERIAELREKAEEVLAAQRAYEAFPDETPESPSRRGARVTFSLAVLELNESTGDAASLLWLLTLAEKGVEAERLIREYASALDDTNDHQRWTRRALALDSLMAFALPPRATPTEPAPE